MLPRSPVSFRILSHETWQSVAPWSGRNSTGPMPGHTCPSKVLVVSASCQHQNVSSLTSWSEKGQWSETESKRGLRVPVRVQEPSQGSEPELETGDQARGSSSAAVSQEASQLLGQFSVPPSSSYSMVRPISGASHGPQSGSSWMVPLGGVRALLACHFQ